MSRKDSTDRRQLSLLDPEPITEGRYAEVDHALRAALAAAIRGCAKLSRYEIAAKISELMGRDVTKSMLDQYTADSAEAHRIPAALLPAFCAATGSRAPLEALAGALACEMVGPEECADLKLARLRALRIKLDRQIREMERGR